MKGHGDLNQSLKKFLVFGRCSAPNVFEGFMGVEKLGVVEQANSAQVLIGIHSFILAQFGTRRSSKLLLDSMLARHNGQSSAYRPKIT